MFVWIDFCLLEWQKRSHKTSLGILGPVPVCFGGFGANSADQIGFVLCRLFSFASPKDSAKKDGMMQHASMVIKYDKVIKFIIPWKYVRFAGENDVAAPAKRNCQWLRYGNGNSQVLSAGVACRSSNSSDWVARKCPISYCARMSVPQLKELTAFIQDVRGLSLLDISRYFEKFQHYYIATL